MTTDELAARRAGRREANLRRANDRIAEAQERLATEPHEPVTILCECAREDCDSTIDLRMEEFDELRDDARRFVVLDGHVVVEIESIVSSGEGWVIVEKRGEAARAAEKTLS